MIKIKKNILQQYQAKNMPVVVYQEKQRQMNDLIELMQQHQKFYNDILKQPVPIPMRILYLTQIEYLNSRQFVLDCLKKN